MDINEPQVEVCQEDGKRICGNNVDADKCRHRVIDAHMSLQANIHGQVQRGGSCQVRGSCSSWQGGLRQWLRLHNDIVMKRALELFKTQG